MSAYVTRVALSVSIGGFLMGFDASVISGTVGFITQEFDLSTLELGWVVSSLALTSTLAMMLAGPLSDRYGRRVVLFAAALLYLVSAVLSALAPSYTVLVVARMIGGLGVGAALIVAPMYIGEIAPAAQRGRMVSLNQLNIVIGISVAFFSNYLLLGLSQGDVAWVSSLGLDTGVWRWMLGVEALPALLFLLVLASVPESPRWLFMQGKAETALAVLTRVTDEAGARAELRAVEDSLAERTEQRRLADLLNPGLRLVLTLGLVVAVLQQITGINAVFFYAPMIFEQSGIGTDAAFLQAVLVGLVNLLFTIVAIACVDRIGRRRLLLLGVSGVAVSMFVIAWGFYDAVYVLTPSAASAVTADTSMLLPVLGTEFGSDVAFKQAVAAAAGEAFLRTHEADLISAAIQANPMLILSGILAFVASFAVSVGPVMWVLFAELFPNWIRGLAISVVGLVNSGVSFGVQFLFPWQLEVLGSASTFLLYGLMAAVGLIIVWLYLPETKGKSLEELEILLAR